MSLLANVLQKHGVGKGDRVVIYMPMIPQALLSMLACARLGAVHALVFGGFAAMELSARIEHCRVRMTPGLTPLLRFDNLVVACHSC